MSLKDILLMCFSNLMRRKGRTFLSVLGVIVGCASIVCMVSIGVGISKSQEAWLDDMGDLTAIDVYVNYGGTAKLDDSFVSQLKTNEKVNFVAAKTSPDDLDLQVSAGNNDIYVAQYYTISGYDEETLDKLGFEMVDGELPTKKGTVAIGQYFEYILTDTRRPEGKNTISRYDPDTYEQYADDELPDPYIKLVGNTLTIGARNEDGNIVYSEEFKVVGRVKSDNNIDYASDEGIIMNSTDLKAFIKNAGSATGTKSTNSYSSVKVYATDINTVSSLQEEINGMGYQTSSMQEMRESTQKQTRTIQLALGGIGAISMLVAAIGIMNTMIMSVSERTKEIGIMKALGCYVTDIRKLFLLEAASIGFLGGFIGSILSCIVSLVINVIYAMMQGIDTSSFSTLVSGIMENRVSIIPIWLFLFGVAFSMIFGLVSGAYPAEKAVKISPLEAMKNE